MFYVLKIEVCDAESLRWQACESKRWQTVEPVLRVRLLQFCVLSCLVFDVVCTKGVFVCLVLRSVLFCCCATAFFWRRIIALLGVLW